MPPPAEGFAARFVTGAALRTQPDRRLVTLVRDGYENAFEEIVRRYGRPLTRYAAGIVGGHAEDVTQDAFSKALLALRRDGAEIELRPWLFRIVRNTALNDLRDSPPSAEALAEAIASGASPAEELERREELADLMRRLQSLPEAQRAAIVMRELEGLSHEKIASALGLSDGGARQAIYRARRSLRDGAGMLLPLPLLKAVLAGAASTPAEAAAGASGAVGAGVALKAAAATVLVAGAVGAGATIDHNRHPSHTRQAAASRNFADEPVPAGAAPGDSGAAGGGGSGRQGEPEGDHGRHDGSRGPGVNDDHSGRGSREDRGSVTSGDDSGGDPGPGGGHGGPGPSGHDGPGADDGGGRRSGGDPGGSSGSGGGSSGTSDSASDDSSGSSSGSGSTGSGGDLNSGSGSGGSGSSEGPGPDGGGGGSGTESSDDRLASGDSGDSRGGDGFSVQTEPQTEEEP
jgi:RNA polymerase sigma factor (sigma-70 family)